jgi:CheY-like chemotaxis protein
MPEKSNFALVPRPPSEIEKAEPGAKRILSVMVADTLALVKKEPPNKRVLFVLVAGSLESNFGEIFTVLIPQAIVEPVSVKVERCEQVGALLKALEHRKFDLAFVYLHLLSPPPANEQQFTDKRETLHRVKRLLEDAWISCEGLVTIELLRRVYGIPVVALTGSGYDGAEMLVKQAGATALFSLPFTVEPFVECLRGILLQSPNQRSRSRPPRIVIVDDAEGTRGIYKLLLKNWFKETTLQEFENGDDAWIELSQTDPDLLITRMPTSGRFLLPLLAERKVKYPILVASSFFGEKEVR